MELFLDSANLEEIRFWSERLSIDGVTTNPTLIAREGIRPGEVVPKIFEIIGQDKLVHVQVLAQDSAGMIKEAYQLRSWHEQVVVKIPLTLEGLQAIKALRASGIRTTATGIVTAPQGLLAAKAGADYVAPMSTELRARPGMGYRLWPIWLSCSSSTVCPRRFWQRALETPARFCRCYLRGHRA